MTSNTINTAGLLSRLFLICVITCEAACSHDEILQEKDPPKCIEQVKPDLGNSGCGDGQRFVQGRCQQERCDADETTPELCCGGQVCDGGGAAQFLRFESKNATTTPVAPLGKNASYAL